MFVTNDLPSYSNNTVGVEFVLELFSHAGIVGLMCDSLVAII